MPAHLAEGAPADGPEHFEVVERHLLGRRLPLLVGRLRGRRRRLQAELEHVLRTSGAQFISEVQRYSREVLWPFQTYGLTT